MKYVQKHDGDRVRPIMKGYRMRCCDCELVHVLDFFVIPWGRGRKVEFKVTRDNRATKSSRKRFGVKVTRKP